MKQKKKSFTILGISIWRLLAYFIIYSVVGYFIETVFSIITKGTWESRQGFLYGPFCAIYGVGAVIMIVFLQRFNKNNNTLFIGGFIIGSITEYVISLLGELLFGVIWWDYSGMPLNINGRICVYFSLFWGFLAIYLMSYFNPKVDKLINWLKGKIGRGKQKTVVAVIILFMFVDFLITGFALKAFNIRMVHNYNIPVEGREQVEIEYDRIYGNEDLVKIIDKFFGDRKMIRTFPNLKTVDKDGNILYFDSLLPDIQPYYYKFEKSIKTSLVEIITGTDKEELEE